MGTLDRAKKLRQFLDRLERDIPARPAEPCSLPEPAEPPDPVLQQFVHAFLVWEAGEPAALEALRRLASAVVDYNELRVCLADEIADMLGPAYPAPVERAQRLRAALNDVFRREHAVSLERLAGLSKRESRQYLESLDGMPQFVAARVALMALGAHAMPVDERLVRVFQAEDVLEPTADAKTGAAWLERQLRAGEAADAYHRVEAWCAIRPPPAPRPAPPAKPAKRPPPRRAGETARPKRSKAQPE